MKLFLYAVLAFTFALNSHGFTVHDAYSSSSSYDLGDIVPSDDDSILFYQALSNLSPNGHELTNTTQWKAWAQSDIPNNGEAPTEEAPDSPPAEEAPTADEIPEDPAGTNGGDPTDGDSIDGQESNSTFWGLAIRAAIGDYPIAGSFVIKGTSNKKVKIRVKGPTMNFGGSKVSDPKITIQKLNEATYAWESYLIVDNWGDHEETATNYSDEATSNTKEPVAILDLAPGTYSVRVQGVDGGSSGSANVEFYGMENDTGNGRFFGLAIRGAIGDYPIAGSFVIKGTSNKKVKIRVKGPTMNFGGSKVSDPKITIQKLNEATYAWESYLIVDNWGDHEETATNYSDEATSNTKEPVAILDLAPGTYSVRVQDVDGGSSGSANVEFYEQD